MFATMKGEQNMNRVRLVAGKSTLGIVAAACWLAISGCVYQVPITVKPTRKIDERLLGTWTTKDEKVMMKVVRLDDLNYIVSNIHDIELMSFKEDLYRAYHSDVAKTALVTVQILDSEAGKPKYCYWAWKLSDDDTLHLRCVNDKIIPDDTKDSASVQKLLKKNLQNPELLGEETVLTKVKKPDQK
jgi:hypothetical protein